MAFGFAEPADGLIADLQRLPDRQMRFMIDFARAYADALTVVVCGRPPDAAAVHARAAWLTGLYPDITVVPAIAPEPRDPARGPEDASAWSERIAELPCARRCALLFGSGGGDAALAAAIGARFVPCLPAAALQYVPTRYSGRDSRPAAVVGRLRRVCLFGPESTGKSTLAGHLARHYATVHVPEYARDYLDATGRHGSAADVPWIARGQRAAEIAGAAQATQILICDTNLATIALWSDVLFGATPDWIREQATRDTYDLWLLTDIDVPFEPDPQRCFPDPGRRAWFMDQCRQTLARIGVIPVPLHGAPAARLAIACAAIDRLLV
ncbi:MAG: ATP-binding protein [Betaproteobacteria bacterium]|nr:ATP-binding protein [Betaproteobacteria bacterium]